MIKYRVAANPTKNDASTSRTVCARKWLHVNCLDGHAAVRSYRNKKRRQHRRRENEVTPTFGWAPVPPSSSGWGMLNLATPAEETQYVRTISARLGSVNSSPASAQACSISVPAVVRAIAVPAPDPVPGLADMRANKIAVGVSAGSAGTLHEA